MVTIKLDKERHLKYTLNTLERFEEITGLHFLSLPEPKDTTIKQMKIFIWAGLVHEDKDLTPEAVGELVTSENITEIYTKATEAFTPGDKKSPLVLPGPSASTTST